MPVLYWLPVLAIVTLVASVGLLARDADDHRGHRRRWAAVGLVATVVLVGWAALFWLIYSLAGSSRLTADQGRLAQLVKALA